MPKRETCLRVARRAAYGSIALAGRKIGVSFNGLQRAETGGRVCPATARKIEAAFGESLPSLQRTFLDELHATNSGTVA